MAVEPRGDEQPAHRGLAEARLPIGRAPLGPADGARAHGARQRGNAPAQLRRRVGKLVLVGLEQATVEVGRDRVEAVAAAQRPGVQRRAWPPAISPPCPSSPT